MTWSLSDQQLAELAAGYESKSLELAHTITGWFPDSPDDACECMRSGKVMLALDLGRVLILSGCPQAEAATWTSRIIKYAIDHRDPLLTAAVEASVATLH